MHTKAFPYIILLSLFWGTNIVASRFGVGEFDPYLLKMVKRTPDPMVQFEPDPYLLKKKYVSEITHPPPKKKLTSNFDLFPSLFPGISIRGNT